MSFESGSPKWIPVVQKTQLANGGGGQGGANTYKPRSEKKESEDEDTLIIHFDTNLDDKFSELDNISLTKLILEFFKRLKQKILKIFSIKK